MPHYENVPFEVPSSWVWITVSAFTHDLQYGTSEESLNKGSVPVLRMGNITRLGSIDYSDLVYSSNEEDIKKYNLQKNDLLFNRTNSSEWVGKTAIFKSDHPAIYAGYLIRVRCIIVNPDYVNLVMNSSYHRDWCNQVKTDAVNQSNINAQKLSNLLIPIPPYLEQLRIVADVEHWFELIDTLESGKLDLQTSIKQAKSKILDLAIHGKLVPQNPADEPASELLKRINPKAEITCDNGQYGKLPDGWGQIMISQVVELLSGRDLTSNDCNEDEEGVPYLIGASNIVNNHLNITRWTKNPQVISSIGDILISCKGTIGEIVLNDIGNIHIARQFMAIRPNKNSIITEYFQYYLLAMVHNIKDNARGVIPGISREDILTKYFPLPPLAEQQRIVDAIDKAFAKLDAIMESL